MQDATHVFANIIAQVVMPVTFDQALVFVTTPTTSSRCRAANIQLNGFDMSLILANPTTDQCFIFSLQTLAG